MSSQAESIPDPLPKKNPVRINSISMKGFRSFEDCSLELPAGLVFVKGPNESGKTGVMKAIQIGLFTDASTKRKDIQELASWGSQESFKIELVLKNQEGKWIITRDFDTGRNILVKPDGTVIRDKHLIAETVAELLGVPKEGAEAAYTASVCVLQDELASGGDDLKKLIENRVAGVDIDVMKLSADANRKMSELSAGSRGGAYKGELTLAKERVALLKDSLTGMESRIESAQKARIERAEAAEQVRVLTEAVSILTQAIEKAKAYAKADQVYSKEINELNRVSKQIEERERSEVKLKVVEAQIKGLTESVNELDSKIKLRQQLDKLDQEIGLNRKEKFKHETVYEKAKAFLKEAENAKEKADGTAFIDADKAAKIEQLSSALHHEKVSLDDAKGALEELQKKIDSDTERLQIALKEESFLSGSISIKEMQTRIETTSSQLDSIVTATKKHTGDVEKLAELQAIPDIDVQKAQRLSAEISALNNAAEGLSIELTGAAGIMGKLTLDGEPAMDVYHGQAKFSALKRVELSLPSVVDFKVSTGGAEEFFEKLAKAQGELAAILKRYDFECVQALCEGLNSYRKAETEVAASAREISMALAAIDRTDEERRPDSDLTTDLLAVAQDFVLFLSKEIQRLEQAILIDSSRLGIDPESLKNLQETELSSQLKTAELTVSDINNSLAELRGAVSILNLSERHFKIRTLDDSIGKLLKEIGCQSTEQMRAKEETFRNLNESVTRSKARADDLLEGSTLEDVASKIAGSALEIDRLKRVKAGILENELLKGDSEKDLLGKDLGEAEAQLSEAQAELRKAEDLRNQIVGGIKAVDLSELKKNQAEVATKIILAETQMNETAPYKMEPMDLVTKEFELKEHTQKLDEAKHSMLAAEARAQAITEGTDDSAAISEELEDALRSLAHLEREVKILAILKDTFPLARTKAVSGMVSLLSKSSSKYIQLMTSGRYSRMDISEDLTPLLYSDSRGGSIDAYSEKTLLSTGTSDQVLLSVRLAMAELMGSGTCPPIIMDDPFVHFDAGRRKAGIEALEQIADIYQVIVFTCHDYPEIQRGQIVDLGVLQ